MVILGVLLAVVMLARLDRVEADAAEPEPIGVRAA
jgi:hypothetical protein